MEKDLINDSLNCFRELRKSNTLDSKVKIEINKFIDLLKDLKSNINSISKEELVEIEIEIETFTKLIKTLYEI